MSEAQDTVTDQAPTFPELRGERDFDGSLCVSADRRYGVPVPVGVLVLAGDSDIGYVTKVTPDLCYYVTDDGEERFDVWGKVHVQASGPADLSAKADTLPTTESQATKLEDLDHGIGPIPATERQARPDDDQGPMDPAGEKAINHLRWDIVSMFPEDTLAAVMLPGVDTPLAANLIDVQGRQTLAVQIPSWVASAMRLELFMANDGGNEALIEACYGESVHRMEKQREQKLKEFHANL